MASADYEIIDPAFGQLIREPADVEKLYGSCQWAEGPVYFPAFGQLIWSDIPNDRMLRYDESNGVVSVFRHPSRYANGNTTDRQGRLVTCEHGSRAVTRTEHDGSITVLADHYDGKRLNSPNDVVVRADGTVWFSDPTYGIDSDYEGHKSASEIGRSNLYRIDTDGTVALVGDDFVQPNGLAFSADERVLYVVDSGASHVPDGPRHIRRFSVSDDNRLRGGAVFAECSNARFDGIRLDTEGRLWAGAGDGVHCLSPEGQLLGKIRLPERAANLCFGGPKRNVLYMCATRSLYRVRVGVNGLR